ncbi:uncharacterized protein ACO6RY_11960 [Pungitius sinensis]
MLDVSFLPVPEQSGEELDEDALDASSESQSPSVDALSNLAADVSEDRTCSSLDAAFDVESEVVEGVESEMEGEMYHSLSGDSVRRTSTKTQSNSGSLTAALGSGETGPSSVISPVTMADRRTPTLAQGPGGQVVRTRTGRVVKAVNRLIENMVQKPLTKGFVDGVNKRSLSLFNLFQTE